MKKKKNAAPKDFVKRRDKVGKKQEASNVTHTNIRQKKLAIPAQRSLAAAKEREIEPEFGYVSDFPLSETLSRTTHAAASERSNAFYAIRDADPKEMKQLAAACVEKCCAAMVDPEATVRNAARAALDTVLERLGPVASAPFAEILSAYSVAALTGVGDVRMDAFAVCDIVLARVDDSCLAVFGEPIVSKLIQIISPNPDFGALLQEPKAKRAATANTNQIVSSAFGTTLKARFACVPVLLRYLRKMKSAGKKAETAGTVNVAWSEKMNVVPALAKMEIAEGKKKELLDFKTCLKYLFSLMNGFIDLWLECIHNQAVHTADIAAILSVIDLLLIGSVAPSESSSDVRDANRDTIFELFDVLQKHFLVVFPFYPKNNNDDHTSKITEMNVCMVRIFVVFLSLGKTKCERACKCYASHLYRYVCLALRGFITATDQEDADFDVSDLSFDRQDVPSHVSIALTEVFDSFRALLDHFGKEQQAYLLACFFSFCSACPAKSTARFHSLKLLQSIVDFETLTENNKRILGELPKMLWQLKTDNMPSTEIVLSVLTKAGQALPEGALDFIQDSMVPFFATVIPTKKRGPQLMFGPFADLPVELQKKAAFLPFYFSSLTPGMERAMYACVLKDTVAPEAMTIIFELFEHHAKHDSEYLMIPMSSLVMLSMSLLGKVPDSVVAMQCVEKICGTLAMFDDIPCDKLLATLEGMLAGLETRENAFPVVAFCDVLKSEGFTSVVDECLRGACTQYMLHENSAVKQTMLSFFRKHPAYFNGAVRDFFTRADVGALQFMLKNDDFRLPELLLNDFCRATFADALKDASLAQLHTQITMIYH